MTPPLRPVAMPYRRYSGCVEAIFDARRLAAPKYGLLGYVAVRAVPDAICTGAPNSCSGRHSGRKPPPQ